MRAAELKCTAAKRLLQAAQECRRFGVQVPQDDYLRGWRDGYDEWQRLMGSLDFN